MDKDFIEINAFNEVLEKKPSLTLVLRNADELTKEIENAQSLIRELNQTLSKIKSFEPIFYQG